MPDRTKPSTAWAAAVVVTAACVLSLASASAASAATTTSCVSGYSIGPPGWHFPSPTVHLGTSCTGFSDGGSPYVFKIAYFNAISTQQPYNTPYYNITATCTAYSYSGTDLVATGCTFSF
ncbi:hypothetical protein [Amycolatopsis vastitatis]|uniref:Secreted protein n=1 Tax=Amycolatopsis vastitatis TaxID=1905142 RepID=A0A229SN40_9PSEU|nr:hypothetical protein [Amycolatopsis vastitatis]OXM60253.1 hypothetical protein CF165_43285 [Amycolatopsis vastitatis]